MLFFCYARLAAHGGKTKQGRHAAKQNAEGDKSMASPPQRCEAKQKTKQGMQSGCFAYLGIA
jgi:hypothetical protein